KPGAEWRQAGGKFCPAGRAERDRRVGIAKAHPGVQQSVQVRRLDTKSEGLAPGKDVDHVIHPDDTDVVARDAVRVEAHQPPVSFSRAGNAQRRTGPSPKSPRKAPRLAG